MPKSEETSVLLSTRRDARFETNVIELKSRLPEDAVGEIVTEVLNRITAYKTVNGDRVNQPTRRKLEGLCYALISDDPNEGADFIQDVQDDGASLDAIYLSYLAEAAGILGEWWDEDHVTFHEVTIASSRIYAILRRLSYLFVPKRPVEVKSAVFATVPGETHLLGVQMAADLFGSEGWNIEVLGGLPHEALVAQISESPCHILGLSAGGAHAEAALVRLIVAVHLSRPDMRIFLSGQIVTASPEFVALLDIDGSASEIEAAKQVMASLWSDLTTSPG